jgi:hypothetical protein
MFYNHWETQRDSDAPTTGGGGIGYFQRIDDPAFEKYIKTQIIGLQFFP